MARQSFRGAGGGGAVVLPYCRGHRVGNWDDASEPALEVDRRTGALMVLASGLLTLLGILAAAGAIGG